MKSVSEHIHTIRQKPHHERRRIALMTAFAGSALVAVVWFVGVFSTGTFAIQGANFAESTADTDNTVVTVPANGNAALVGAAAAAEEDPTAPAHIEIVSSATSSTLNNSGAQPEQTVIPF